MYAVCINNCTFSDGHASIGGGELHLKYSVNLLKSCAMLNPLSWLHSLKPLPPHAALQLTSHLDRQYSLLRLSVIDIQICLSHFEITLGGRWWYLHHFSAEDFGSQLTSYEIQLLWVLKGCTFHRNDGREGAGMYVLLPWSPWPLISVID